MLITTSLEEAEELAVEKIFENNPRIKISKVVLKHFLQQISSKTLITSNLIVLKRDNPGLFRKFSSFTCFKHKIGLIKISKHLKLTGIGNYLIKISTTVHFSC